MTEFNEESLSLLIDTAIDSSKAENFFSVVGIGGTNEIALVDRISKTVTYKPKSPPTRNHKLLSIMDVVAWAKSQNERTPIIWIGESKITITLDAEMDRARGDIATYEFRMTPEFAAFVVYAQQNPNTSTFKQADLVKLLRTTLWNNFESTSVRDELVKSLRNVVAQQQTQIQQGRGTFDATMATQNGTAETWPERLKMVARVFDDISLVTTERIDVVFEVNAKDQTFSLWPTTSSIMTAMTNVREHASELIRAAVADKSDDVSIQVYAGNPI